MTGGCGECDRCASQCQGAAIEGDGGRGRAQIAIRGGGHRGAVVDDDVARHGVGCGENDVADSGHCQVGAVDDGVDGQGAAALLIDDHFSRAAGQRAACGGGADASGSRRGGHEDAAGFQRQGPRSCGIKCQRRSAGEAQGVGGGPAAGQRGAGTQAGGQTAAKGRGVAACGQRGDVARAVIHRPVIELVGGVAAQDAAGGVCRGGRDAGYARAGVDAGKIHRGSRVARDGPESERGVLIRSARHFDLPAAAQGGDAVAQREAAHRLRGGRRAAAAEAERASVQGQPRRAAELGGVGHGMVQQKRAAAHGRGAGEGVAAALQCNRAAASEGQGVRGACGGGRAQQTAGEEHRATAGGENREPLGCGTGGAQCDAAAVRHRARRIQPAQGGRSGVARLQQDVAADRHSRSVHHQCGGNRATGISHQHCGGGIAQCTGAAAGGIGRDNDRAAQHRSGAGVGAR